MISFVWSLAAALLVVSADPVMTSAVGTGQQGYAGDGGPAVRARLNQPFDIVCDGQGNLYLSHTYNHCIRRLDGKTGRIDTIAGNGTPGFSGDGGPAARAQFNEPYGFESSLNRKSWPLTAPATS